MMTTYRRRFLTGCAVTLIAGAAFAQDDAPKMIPAPDRGADEGEGPYGRLIIRGATLIDGTGSPPIGPVDIVIEDNRIVDVDSVGYPGLEIDEDDRPTDATREIGSRGKDGCLDRPHAVGFGGAEGACRRVHGCLQQFE
jgi:hypothetical protein